MAADHIPTAAELAASLNGKKFGSEWKARCPAHDDRNPSLSIRSGTNGVAVVRCHAGCSQEAVIAALQQRGLWPRPEERRQQQIETVYGYRETDGRVRYEVVRWAGKKFSQRQPIGDRGGYLREGPGPGMALPYRLPELLAAPVDQVVFVVEGEKDCENLANRDLVATCNHGGANKWRKEISHWLKGRQVVILPDNDDTGRAHAADVAHKLAGVAASVRILDLPGLPPKGDVSDWLATGGDRQQLLALAAAAPLAQPAPAPPLEVDEDAEIARLARLKIIAYEREREAAAKRLGLRTGTLDRLVKAAHGDDQPAGKQGKAVAFDDPAPAGEPVDGGNLVAEIRNLLKRHISLPPGAGWAVAVWCLHTFVFATGEHTPRLAVVSPERGCGKTTLLDLLARLVYRPLSAASLTAAATFRVIDRYQPTLLIDEADAFLKDNEELRGVLNAGHRYDGAVLRVVGEDMEPRRFDVFGPVAIALIGALPGTLADRSITVRMRRAGSDEAIAALDQATHDNAMDFVRRARRWAADHRAGLRNTKPVLPNTMWNRTADNWRPLFAIAEACGNGLPDLLAGAADALLAQQVFDQETAGVMLLADIRQVFDAAGVDRLASSEIVARLVELEERPWAAFRRDKPLSARQTADMLRSFGILSGTVRPDPTAGKTAKGYYRKDFKDAWRRYLDARAEPA